MRKFDTKVQYLKYKVLREVAKHSWNGTLSEKAFDIPKDIIPGKEPTIRCCVYKERAILAERVKLAMGIPKENNNIIHVIDIACDECPMGGYEVTEACRGCLAHRCEDVCKFGAITFDSRQKAIIDKSKCKECGKCSKVCPYSAIINHTRPCEKSCKVKAITMNETKAAAINYDKCINCGACVYQCPWGAITDKSFITNCIDILKGSENGKNYKVYAVIAPSISSQFIYAKLGQVFSGIKELGFHRCMEAALGADMVSYKESKELTEKGFLMSSCCPAFVSYVEKSFPALKEHISENLSPAATISKYIKEKEPTAKVVFIGPCTAKKGEILKPEVAPYMDCVITFEELQALFDSKGIDITALSETALDTASYFGRIFARSGGLTDAVKQGISEHGSSFEYNPVSCNGIEECRTALLKKSKNVLQSNFIEGMACINGCIGGAGCLTHGEKNRSEVDTYGSKASAKTITEAITSIEIE